MSQRRTDTFFFRQINRRKINRRDKFNRQTRLQQLAHMSAPHIKKAAAKSFRQVPDACVRCKGMGHGAPTCRQRHNVEEYPPTPLTQVMCIALMRFRTPSFPQAGLIADQQMLQQALKSGGPKSVAAAMDVLKGLGVDAYAKQNALDVDALPTAAEDTWEWSLTKWAEPPPRRPDVRAERKAHWGRRSNGDAQQR